MEMGMVSTYRMYSGDMPFWTPKSIQGAMMIQAISGLAVMSKGVVGP